MNTYKIEQLDDFSTFSEDVYLDKKFILLPSHMPLDAKLKEKLLEDSFVNLYSEGDIEDLGVKKNDEINTEDNQSQEVVEETEEETEEDKKNRLEIENIYITFLSNISKIYSTYASRQKLDLPDIFVKARGLYDFVKKHKHKIVSIPQDVYADLEPAVILHVMRTAVFAIIIAIQVKMPEHRIIELTVAAILHKIGFLKIPPQLYAQDKTFTDKELKTFKSHPVVSYRILKEAQFPSTVCAGVLEHHEREDGSGYPRAIKDDDISIFGKILSVACSFEASTGEFKDNYGINKVLDVVRNSNKQYSDIILKSLLFSISVFPIGTFVQLSDKRIGQVVDINPKNLAYPTVLIYGSTSLKGGVEVVSMSPNGVTIVKPLTKAEIDEVKKTHSKPSFK